jgi:hypothetical protein
MMSLKLQEILTLMSMLRFPNGFYLTLRARKWANNVVFRPMDVIISSSKELYIIIIIKELCNVVAINLLMAVSIV